MGRWQDRTYHQLNGKMTGRYLEIHHVNCSRVWFMITLGIFLRIIRSLSCLLATRVRVGDASVVADGAATRVTHHPGKQRSSLVLNSVGSRLCLRRVLVTRQMTAHSLKMNGLLLASYRANSTPCSLTTCVATAACAYTSPQPTDCSGPWVLESA